VSAAKFSAAGARTTLHEVTCCVSAWNAKPWYHYYMTNDRWLADSRSEWVWPNPNLTPNPNLNPNPNSWFVVRK